MKSIFLLLMLLYSFVSKSQTDNYFDRLSAIENNGIVFYNIDGYVITSQILNAEFSEKELRKIYKKCSIKKGDNIAKDDSLLFNNIYVAKSEKIVDSLIQNTSYYFIENANKTISVIFFGDRNFERTFIHLILGNRIPQGCFNSPKTDSINFAGRKIALGGNCRWMNVNTIQCEYHGEMNWSVHKNFEDAKNSIESQFRLTKSRKMGKIISEEIVDIIFEGAKTKAKKVVYRITGVNALLVGLSGGKTLTIYYVAAEVRNNYVSCVLSYWNNDIINESGLPYLLEQVMQLKK